MSAQGDTPCNPDFRGYCIPTPARGFFEGAPDPKNDQGVLPWTRRSSSVSLFGVQIRP